MSIPISTGVSSHISQLPLPEHMVERAVCNAVAPHKDVDGFNIVNVGRFCLDLKTLIPCTPLGVQELIRRYSKSLLLIGKKLVQNGKSCLLFSITNFTRIGLKRLA
jgi:5,10-methylene-tetrahydrofolate dehydrogenase/Methenyl tetrahydrofolate cyclohydrolase